MKRKNYLLSGSHVCGKDVQQVGYFALVGGYRLSFKNPTTRKYRNWTTFDDIVALYKLKRPCGNCSSHTYLRLREI